MNKVAEYLIVATVSVFVFLGLVVWAHSANRDALRKDCETMGQSRISTLHIKCEVVPSRNEVPA